MASLRHEKCFVRLELTRIEGTEGGGDSEGAGGNRKQH